MEEVLVWVLGEEEGLMLALEKLVEGIVASSLRKSESHGKNSHTVANSQSLLVVVSLNRQSG